MCFQAKLHICQIGPAPTIEVVIDKATSPRQLETAVSCVCHCSCVIVFSVAVMDDEATAISLTDTGKWLIYREMAYLKGICQFCNGILANCHKLPNSIF